MPATTSTIVLLIDPLARIMSTLAKVGEAGDTACVSPRQIYRGEGQPRHPDLLSWTEVLLHELAAE